MLIGEAAPRPSFPGRGASSFLTCRRFVVLAAFTVNGLAGLANLTTGAGVGNI